MGELYTLGGELILLNGENYVGPYHLINGVPYTGDEGSFNTEELKYLNPPPIISEIGAPSEGNFVDVTSRISPVLTPTTFDPIVNRINVNIKDASGVDLYTDSNFSGWTTKNDPNSEGETVSVIILDPVRDLKDAGLGTDTRTITYDFVKSELLTPSGSSYYIDEISPSRTEIRIKNSNYPSQNIITSYNLLKSTLDSGDFFEGLLGSLPAAGEGVTISIINVLLDNSGNYPSILLKLYNPLPNNVNVNDVISVFSRIASPKAYQVEFPPISFSNLEQAPGFYTYLDGPNTNIAVKNKINNSTGYQTLSTLDSSSFSGSLSQLESILSIQGVRFYPSYSLSSFDEFVNFSSAKARIENFYYKVGQIESFQNDINSINSIVGSTSSSSDVINSKVVLQGKINDIIKEFDGFDYYLYFNSGSDTYPKTNTTEPYTLASTGSAAALTWLGSDIESSAYYGGALLSGSFYDENNASNLLYTIPEYIRSNTDNSNYLLFVSMIGQLFDEIWLYTKGVTDKLNNTNQLEKGAPLELVEEIITSLGFQVFGNNYGSQNIYSSVLGINPDGTFTPPTGSEIITNYVAVNSGSYPIDRVSKEIYKRIYSNISTLQKKKGTVAGLRQLINIYGIPDTILRISEFGGKDKVNTNDWDLYRRIYNKSISTFSGSLYSGNVAAKAWELHPSWSINPSIPRTVEFRFKSILDPDTLSFEPNIRQRILSKGNGLTDDSVEVAVALEYNGSGSASGSFSGSIKDPENKNADLTLYISGSSRYYSSSINLPFLNQDWWSVMLNYVSGSNKFELYAGNTVYDGDDGTQLGFTGNTSITLPSYEDTLGYRSSLPIVQFNSVGTGSITGKTFSKYSGSLQEVRYWTNVLPESAWHNHIMNPLSIETGIITGSGSPVETLAFRTREGEDISFNETSNSNLISIHPKITGSTPVTHSFVGSNLSKYGVDDITTETNKEIQFFNQPIFGIRNRVSDKIRDYGNAAYGDVLSPISTIQQNYEASQSYTEDTNLLEVAFSPQNEINDDIINEFGSNNQLNGILADPRNLSSSLDHYSELRNIALRYFEKYIKANPNYYYRLIKYIDNSLFKTIKEYVPSRTSVSTGIVVKQHLLERNRVRPPQLNTNTTIAKTPEGGFNSAVTLQNLILTGSVKSQVKGYTTGSPVERFLGGTGGTFEKFNNIEFSPYGTSGSGPTPKNGFEISQSFTETVSTLSGSINIIRSTQDEFYNGEFNGATLVVTTQSLNAGCIKFHNVLTNPPPTSSFDYFLYNELFTASIAAFSDARTAPNAGEMFIGYNSAAPFLRTFKVSTTDKEGNNIEGVLTDATRLSFNFGTSIENFDVTQNGQGPGFIQYEVNQNLSPSQPEFLLSSSYENYPFLASGSAGVSSSVIVDGNTPFFQTSYTTTVPLTDYAFEIDNNNLFETASGVYRLPGTPNLQIKYTGSVNYTGSIRLKQTNTNLQSSSVKLQLKSNTLPPFNQYFDEVQINTGGGSNIIFTGSLLVSGSFNGFGGNVPIKDDELSLELSLTIPALEFPTAAISASITGSGALFSVSTGSRFPFPSSTELTSFEPYILGGLNGFEHEFDCQPLFNNVIVNRPSALYYDVDYTFGSITPVNIFPLLNFDAEPARTPDSNYTQKSRVLPRYEGSKISSLKLNKYSEKGTQYVEKGNLKTWGGDKSYGKVPVIERTNPYFGYFQLLIPTSPELEGATQTKLKYLIDLDGQVAKPVINSPSFFNVEGTFETGDTVDIALEDTLQTDDPSLVNAAVGINLDNFNKSATVIKGARRVDPIITTQKLSINDVTSPGLAFESTITTTNPSGITSDYSVFAHNTTQQSLDRIPTPITFDTEVWDKNNNFNGTKFIFNEVPQTKLNFRFNGNIINTAGGGGTIEHEVMIIRERNSVRTALNTIQFQVPTNGTVTPFEVQSGFLDFQNGDQIYARASFAFTQAGVSTDENNTDNEFLGPGSAVVIDSAFISITPEELPTIELTAPFWSTGSAYGNYFTSSTSMSIAYGQVQQQYSDSTFKPINEPFTIQVGDEFRIEGRENLVFLVNEVIEKSTDAGTSGSILVRVEPDIPPLMDLSRFLIRRYNRDGTSVLIDLIPPSSSFTTTKGLIKNTPVDDKLEQNISEVISKLSQEGTI